MSRVWFDVSNLVGWSGPLTGMQRVAVSLIREYLKLDSNTGLVTFNPDVKTFNEVPASLIEDLAVSNFNQNQLRLGAGLRYRVQSILKAYLPEWTFPYLSMMRKYLRWVLGQVKRSLNRNIHEFSSPFESGDKLVALEVTWGRHNYVPYLPYFMEKFGFDFFHLVHDIIPIKFPQFYDLRFSPHFREHIRQVIQHSTGILVYSENSKNDILKWAHDEGLQTPSISKIHLGSDFGSASNPIEVSELTSKNFCLYVSTLEIRKNHILLLKTWINLLSKYGENAPYLVFAGRRGWMIQETLDFLKDHPELNTKLIWLQHCSDNELDWLYNNCMLTLYPSLYEGWGLPVVESLARGKMCLASESASIPEAGQNFAIYFNPNSVNQCFDTITNLIDHPNILIEKELDIKNRYRRTKWSETASDLYDILRTNPTKPISNLIPSTGKI